MLFHFKYFTVNEYFFFFLIIEINILRNFLIGLYNQEMTHRWL